LEEVDPTFVGNVGKAYEAMFESTSLTDSGMQDDLYAGMKKRYVLQRVGYIGPEYYDEIREEPGKGKYGDQRVDYIWEMPSSSTESQTGEVLEHLLHTLTAIGFHYAFSEEWAWNDSESDVRMAMQEAIDAGHYDVSGYDNLKSDEEYHRILAQEFAYWMIMAEWDYFGVIGMTANEEWDITTPAEMAKELPLGHELYNSSVIKLISKPEASLMGSLFGR